MSSTSALSSDADFAFPLSAAQTDIYIAQSLAPSVPFTIAQYVDINGDLDTDLLVRATDIASRELESPGIRLFERDGIAYQWVDWSAPYALVVRDFRDTDDPVGAARRHMDERIRTPVDMLRDQLVVAEVLRVGEQRYFWFSRAHHVVMDGLGAIALQERTATVYNAVLSGTEIPPTRAWSTARIHEYEHAYIDSSRYISDRDYWTDRLSDRPDRTRLAGRAEVPATTALAVGVTVDGETLSVPDVLAAFALYLARMTGSSDVMMSLPVSGRTTAMLRESSGMMSNVVPLRLFVEPSATVGQLRARVQAELVGALRHQRFRIQDGRRADFGPTVNIMMFGTTIRFGSAVGDYRVLSSGPLDDLMLNMYPGVAGASTRVDFLGNPTTYTQAEITEHHRRFLILLRELAAADEDCALASLRVTEGVAEQTAPSREIPGRWVGVDAAPSPVLLTSLIRGEADAEAMRFGSVTYTYAELDAATNTVATQLVSRGAGPEVRVATAVDRSHLSVLANIGVSKAGASFVPVDPSDPRLPNMLSAAGIRLGLASSEMIPRLPEHIDWLNIETMTGGNHAPAAAVPYAAVPHVDNEAYLVHTSGTTGTPKGVSVSHRGLAALASGARGRYRVTSESRVLHLASPVFDASIQEILMAFAAGATLVIAPTDVYAGPDLAELIARERITHLVTAPAVLATLTPDDLGGVEVFDVGGEACPPELRDAFLSPDRAMLDAYGPTEATVLATVSAPMVAGEPVNIGTPLPGVRALVLDGELRRVPSGAAGELYLGGDGVARGYAGQPGLTAAHFVADPAEPGRRLYRTGDRIRRSLLGDALEFLGRADSQVQIHGRRVELGEIESVLLRHRSVDSAVVVVRDDALVAYVVGDTADLDAHLRKSLPSWMIPTNIVGIDSVPLNSSGKPDRSRLPDIVPVRITEYAVPRTDTEWAVAAVFEEILGVDSFGRNDAFFARGGDSLGAARVLARLTPRLTLAELFDHPTVAGLAGVLDSTPVPADELNLLDTTVPQRIPLSYAQQRIWVIEQFDAESSAYTMPAALELPPGTDSGIAIAALRDVLARHESLRTYYPVDNDGPHQQVVPAFTLLGDVPTRVVDFGDLEQAVDAAARKGFDVAAEVPLRVELLVSGERTVLVIVAHHIAVDGWSLAPLVRDFSAAYLARSAGHAPTWQPLAVQYSQYTVWNRAVVDAAAEQHLDYWRSVFPAGEEPIAELPADNPRPRTAHSPIGRIPVEFDGALHRGLHEIAQSREVTPFMIIHAALAATLSRYRDVDRTVVGTPSAGRGHAALENMVGMFVGTVPLAVTIDRGAPFEDVLTSVRRADLDAFAHADVPFERIVDAVSTGRSIDRHPLFRVMLSFDNVPHESTDGLPLAVRFTETTASEFDLNLVLSATSDTTSGYLEYSTDLYLPDTAAAFTAAFLQVLTAVIADPSVVAGDIELPSSSAAGAGQNHDQRVAEPGTMLDLLPLGNPAHDNPAIDGEITLSYDELDRQSNRLARLLVTHGAGPERAVALSMSRSARYLVALWAVVKSGAAFVPVDPDFPAPRREAMLTRCILGIGGSEPGTTWLRESDAEELGDSPLGDADRLASLLPDHPAYIVHTSGSTGAPKPVTVTHRSVYALAQQVIPKYAVTPDSRVLHGYSVNFDAAVLELVLAFGSGATLVLAPADMAGGEETAEFLGRHCVTHFLSTPAVLATVPPVDCVETVAVGGDVLPASVAATWSPGRRMLNAYGPAESTVVATLTEPLDARSRITIGAPLDFVRAVVLDRRLVRVPVGGIGELYLGGVGLARAYGEYAALTTERFVAAANGERLYRTGDIVRIAAGGRFDFVGREDSQVQIRGVRIELGDVESAITSQPGVEAAVVAVHDDVLLAWVVGNTVGLVSELWNLLPASMVPTTIVSIDSIPLTDNGKIDVAALEIPPDIAPVAHSSTGLAEEVVAGVFADLLGHETVSVDANFFALGGDSLIATRAVTRIASALAVAVPVRMLFQAPTARLLAAAASTLSDAYVALPALEHSGAGADAVSAAERRIWLQNRLDPESSAYNVSFAIPLPRDLDLDALRSAVLDLVERHAPLRTIYRPGDTGPVVAVQDTADAVAPLTITSIEPGKIENALLALASAGFDLTAEVPLRLAVLDGGEGSLRLSVVAHHIAVDGLSLAPLAQDARIALTARLTGARPDFTPLVVDYADYRRWQREVLAVVGETQLAFWTRTLEGLPDYLELPTGLPDASAAANPVEFGLDGTMTASLRSLAGRLGATAFVVVHAALALVLAELSGGDDIAVGTPVAGRSDPELDALVGMFVGTIVLRTVLDRSMTFAEFVTAVRDRDLDAFANADVPFDDVVETLDPARHADTHPFFQVLLSVSSLRPPVLDLGEGEVEPRQIRPEEPQFDLEVVVDDSSDVVTGSVSYAPARFERSIVTTLADRLVALLHSVIETPDIELQRLDVLGTDGVTPVHRPGIAENATLGKAFADAAVRWADSTAVIDGARRVTYAELHSRAESLASQLIESGAGPGQLVAISLPRSIEHVVALWAVAWTGAAFLPLDPAHPSERVAEILAEARPVVGVSRGGGAGTCPWISVDGADSHGPAERQIPLVDDVAYVIYTSGSTGTPKGVQITHRGIANLVHSQRELFGVDENSRVLQFASPSFDASVFEILLATGSGACLITAPGNVYAGRELEALVSTTAVTHVCLTPAVLQVTDASAVPSVHTVIMAGDAVNSELVQRWSDGRAVFNAYGPTESTVMGTCTADLAGGRRVTIGAPSHGFDALVLDTRLRQVPGNVVGELYLAGPGLARGYVDRAAITSNRFVPNPFGRSGSRMYRTGDLVRWVAADSANELEFLGRVDSQVKIRGHRVELAEVEAALLAHEGVEQACAIGHSSEAGTVLAAYVVGAVDRRELRSLLSARVPSYMIPTVFVEVESLPMSIAGKIDRSRLPAPSYLPAQPVAVKGELERTIRDVFAEVLDVDAQAIGADLNFFELGGHSLAAVRAADNLERALGCRVPAAWLFTDQTVAGLAARIESSPADTSTDNAFGVLLPLAPYGNGAPVFCIHPAVGVAWSYAALAAAVDRPVYGLQMPGLDGNEVPPERIEDYAARYIREIKRIRPHGPYILLGWSLGGVIAHAVATALQAGDSTALVLVDARLSAPEDAEEFGLADLADQLGVTGSTFDEIAQNLRIQHPETAFVTVEHLRNMYRPVVDASTLVASYEADVYTGDTVYFSARGSDGASQWQPFLGRPLRVRHVDVEHDAMLHEDGVRAISRELRSVSVSDRQRARTEGAA